MTSAASRPLPRRAAAALALAAAAALLPAASCRRAPRPRNVVLVTLDTTRADFLGASGAGRAATPALDALAAEGTYFEDAWSLIPITLPSHASILYSRPPHDLANYNNGQVYRKSRARASLANLMRKAGFATAAFVSLGVLGRSFGLDEGFLEYEDAFPGDRWYLTADEVNRRALPWLERNKDKPFFLWVHYSDPHEPYALPDAPDDLSVALNGAPLGRYCLSRYEMHAVDVALKRGVNVIRLDAVNPWQDNPEQFMARLDRLEVVPAGAEAGLEPSFVHGWYVRRQDGVFFFKNGSTVEVVARAAGPARLRFRGQLLVPPERLREVVPDLYRREVEHMDARFGELRAALAKAGLAGSTAVVVAGDHGEGLGEYLSPYGDAHVGHIHNLQSLYLKVPFIVASPGRRPARRRGPVSLLDVTPTICGLAGIDPPAGAAGIDVLKKRKDDPRRPLFGYTFRPEAYQDRFGLREGGWHMIFTPDTGHFDLYDLARDPGETVNRYDTPGLPPETEALKKKLLEHTRAVLKSKVEVSVSPKDVEMLRSLGYLK